MIELSSRTIEDIKEVAYRPEETSLSDKDIAYAVVRNPGKNLTILPSYRLGGGEYPKTYGHFHTPPYAETYQVLFGKAGLLLQQMDGEKVKKILFRLLEEGEAYTVPEEFETVLVNLGQGYLITQDNDDPELSKHSYDAIRKTHGFGYYIVEESGVWKAVPNPAYPVLPALLKE